MTDAGDVPGSRPNKPKDEATSVGPPRGNPIYSVDPQDVIDAIQRPKLIPKEDARMHADAVPVLDLPSFGEPDDKCGDPTPASMMFCPSCATVHEKPHVCYRYDCPIHWAHAVRRRAAGSKSGAGVAPQLDALRRYLNAYRDDNQYFHHLVVSLGADRRLAANNPLEREKETIREIMDAIGVQGLVVYHPLAGDNEDHDGDDRGEWKDRIGKDTEWDDVKGELEYRPHWHIIGVAPFVDFSDTPVINDETGAVLVRITQDDSNRSISRREGEKTDDHALARAVTYALSHGGIYNTEGGQRRLAAWMMGPDVDRITPLAKNKARMQAIVYNEAATTLGIDPPNLKCDNDLDESDDETEDVDRDLPGRRRPILDVWESDDVNSDDGIGAAPTGNGIIITPQSGPGGPRAGSGGTRSSATALPKTRDPFESSWSGSRSSSRSASSTSSRTTSATSTSTPSSEGETDASHTDGDSTCGSRLRHISQANEFILDREWNENHDDDAVEDVETAYLAYVTWMEAQGHEPHEDPFELPAERDEPPPDD